GAGVFVLETKAGKWPTPLLLIPPHDPPHRPYFGKPSHPNALPLPRRRALRLGVHEFVLAAALAAHLAAHEVRFDVAENLQQIVGLIPTLDVAESAADEHELPDLVGIAEPPPAAALSSSVSIRHD
ncbi:hypothetical protein, partial [Mesorhizobium sp. M4A.F.Ca.ET.050.02.1.1]|uniref:hypothetical protein n=1 Tax=Mesorhizobium sp. M4A.F.Ca.ET.050.02.1.1 TaxID=2496754 RepID=UPI001AECAF78